MACKAEERTIGGRRFVVVQMPPTISIPIQVKLVQILSVAVVPLLGELKSDGNDTLAVGLRAMGTAAAGLGEAISRHMPPDEFLQFAQTLTSGEYVSAGEGENCAPILFESEFMGDDMVRLYPLLAFILEVNYAQFFSASGLASFVDLAKEKFQSAVSKASLPT